MSGSMVPAGSRWFPEPELTEPGSRFPRFPPVGGTGNRNRARWVVC